MNKIKSSEFIARIAQETGLSKSKTSEVIGVVFDEIRRQLLRGTSVGLKGFGTFSVQERKPRTGFDPNTKRSIQIPAKKVVVFKLSSVFKEELNL